LVLILILILIFNYQITNLHNLSRGAVDYQILRYFPAATLDFAGANAS